MRDDIVEVLCEINPLLDLDDEDLNIAEFLKSKQLMELIAKLEDMYDVDIPYDDIDEYNFENMETIIKLLNKLM